jgi:bifunctional UDP-N-acetylglucosamine pyrophosphorylase/glucosamine-1-phosphate N-acetyltransferase
LAADGYPLAWINDEANVPAQAETLGAAGSFRVRYPWDLLRINKELVGALSEDQIKGSLSDRATVEGHLILGTGSRVLPGVFVEGNAIIGRDCKIGPNCYLRGDTSIGDGCHIGQAVEIKNSIVMAQTSIGHLSYCGDSVIGTGVNLGAGTITANLRHDGRDHMSMVGGALVDTGRRKLGAVIGDDVHTGIHTSIYPGRKIWPGKWTRPGAIVRTDIGPDKELGS